MLMDESGEVGISFTDEIEIPPSWTEKMENDKLLDSPDPVVRRRALEKSSSFNFLSMKVGSPANEESADQGLDQSNMIITGISPNGLSVKVKF